MAEMEESISINRPRRDVFEFIVTPENMYLWMRVSTEKVKELLEAK